MTIKRSTKNWSKAMLILNTMMLIGLGQLSIVSQAQQISKTTPPISNYSQEVQQIADQLMQKGWLVGRRYKKVQNYLAKWQNLAERCDDLSDTTGTTFNSRACRNYARATRVGSLSEYNRICIKLNDWIKNKQSILNRNLEQANPQNTNLQLATEAAIAQLQYETESICAEWASGKLSENYEHLVRLEIIQDRPSANYMVQFRMEYPGVYPDYSNEYLGQFPPMQTGVQIGVRSNLPWGDNTHAKIGQILDSTN